MARNGSGTYTLPEAAFVNGTVIDEVAMNSNFSDIETEITNSVDKDGQTTWTGNMNAGSNKITNMAVGSASTDSARYDQTIAGGKLNATAGFGSVAHTDGVVHITSGSAGSVSANAGGDELVIEGNGAESGLSILNTDANSSTIKFASPSGNNKASITYSHALERMAFTANNVGMMYLDGNIHFGQVDNATSAAKHLHIGIGTSPTATIADGVTIGAKDSSVGATDATLELWLETAPIVVGTFTASHKFPIWINGTEYHIQLDAV